MKKLTTAWAEGKGDKPENADQQPVEKVELRQKGLIFKKIFFNFFKKYFRFANKRNKFGQQLSFS